MGVFHIPWCFVLFIPYVIPDIRKQKPIGLVKSNKE